MKTEIHSIQIPPCTREFAEIVQKTFPPIDIKPGTTNDSIMFSAGEQKVVQYLLRQSREKSMYGVAEELKDNKQHNQKGLLYRLLGV